MRKSIIPFLFLSLICFTACISDKGNYDYIPEEELQIKAIAGIDKEYVRNNMQQLEIKPIFNKDIHDADYDFCWYAYAVSKPQKVDTISRERNLDYRVTLAAGDYNVIYRAKRKSTGICLFQEFNLKVASIYNDIWIVTKDDGTHTDIDVVTTDGEIYSNVLAQSNYGEKLSGKAVKSGFIMWYKHVVTNPDGTTTARSYINGMTVMSSKEVRIYDMDNMGILKNYPDVFFGSEPSGQPAWSGGFDGVGYALVIGKRIFAYANSSGQSGKFLEKAGIYECGGGIIPTTVTTKTFLFFDEISHSLKKLSGNDDQITDCSETATAAISCRNMPYDLKYMEVQNNGIANPSGLAIFTDPETNTCYSAELGEEELGSGLNPIKTFQPIPEDCKINKASILAVNQYTSTLYFAHPEFKNELWSFDFSNRREVRQVSLPRGEDIVYAKQIIIRPDQVSFKRTMAILTNPAGKWKLYLLDFIGETPDINEESISPNPPTGSGNACHVMYKNSYSSPI